MPSWVGNRIEFRGPKNEIQRMIDECFTRETVDNRSAFTDFGEKLLTNDDTVLALDFERVLPHPVALSVGEHEVLVSGSIEAEQDEAQDTGLDMSEWRETHWGTESKAWCSQFIKVGDQQIVVMFLTAWAVPEGVLATLAHRYPSIEFFGHAVDEGFEFGATVFGKGGYCSSAYKSTRKASMKLWEIVFRHPPIDWSDMEDDIDDAA